ncbi:hypothetical protein M3689_05495 [Alkalihalophilus marmarensis]|uniref:HipA family kinase n=1 Tax=Alkalihalophilus marmarensis TaxID=521377 RepID=UPI00204104D8|nr:HipA family kinase [Alkalihalophilus marmarensis]MCM3488760.1 hypothetical protein [Alkalihalophilus marmarensis]
MNVPIYKANNVVRLITNGCTEPLLMNTTGGAHVVKVLENEQGPKALINELVCYKLGKQLKIPIPQVALIELTEELIRADSELTKRNVKPGLHFGSSHVPKSAPSIGEPMLSFARNKEDIPRIILYDQIIYNADRTKNKGNLLLDMKEKRLVAIDHTHTFKLGTIWDIEQLKKVHEDDICLVSDFHGHNYKHLLKYVNGHNPFASILLDIKSLSQADINSCFDGVPQEWGLSSSQKGALKDFIQYRIDNIETILQLLQKECHFWKGGF